MDNTTLQPAPSLWYWSEPASGYSIEDCEQIVAQELRNIGNSN